MDFTTLIQDMGFPIACVLALGWYINKKDQDAKEERNREREDDKQEKERLFSEIGYNREVNAQLLKTNQEVSETNRILVKDFTDKVDKIDTKVDMILEKVDKDEK